MSFVFVDGRIDSVCPRADDETWAVNIRRGILSTLQNTMTSFKGVFTGRETDIAGNCPVIYEVTASNSGTFFFCLDIADTVVALYLYLVKLLFLLSDVLFFLLCYQLW